MIHNIDFDKKINIQINTDVIYLVKKTKLSRDQFIMNNLLFIKVCSLIYLARIRPISLLILSGRYIMLKNIMVQF